MATCGTWSGWHQRPDSSGINSAGSPKFPKLCYKQVPNTDILQLEGPQWGADSIGRRNTLFKSLSRRMVI
jgi:hypothetical protein